MSFEQTTHKICKELLDKIRNDYADKAEHIDNNVASDSRAMKLFTRLEIAQDKDESVISDFLILCEKYMGINSELNYENNNN